MSKYCVGYGALQANAMRLIECDTSALPPKKITEAFAREIADALNSHEPTALVASGPELQHIWLFIHLLTPFSFLSAYDRNSYPAHLQQLRPSAQTSRKAYTGRCHRQYTSETLLHHRDRPDA